MLKTVKRNFIKSILVSLAVLAFGIILIFSLTLLIPGDPVLAYLPEGQINWAVYEQLKQQLGLNDPLIIQFFRYIGDLLVGNLGYSFSIARGMSVHELLVLKIPTSVGFSLPSLISGLIAGIFLGTLSIKTRKRFVKLLIQIVIILGISMPFFFIGICLQYFLAFQLQLFPSTGNPLLPSSILFVLTLALTTRQVRSNYLKTPKERDILSKSLHIIFYSSIFIASITLLENIFGLSGFFSLIILAFRSSDFWVIRGGLYVLVLLLTIILLLSNFGYIIYKQYLEKSKSRLFNNFFARSEQVVEESARYSFNSDKKFKEFTLYRLKSPLTIIGLAIVVFAIIVTIFPHLLTPYTIEETIDIYSNWWAPPSPEHPLGQSIFGRDVLALLTYGVSISIKVSAISVLIGMVLGTLFGYLAKVHKIVRKVVLGIMVILFIIPSIFMIIIGFGAYYILSIPPIVGIIGIYIGFLAAYIIPSVALLISEGNYSFKLTVKKLVVYMPLYMGINILIFESVAFLGFSDYRFIQLGRIISNAREFLSVAPWASLWPSLAVFVLVMGFISLHYGLKEPIPIAGRL